MNRVDLNEAMAVMNTVLDGLVATLHGETGTLGATANQLCGALAQNGANELSAGGLLFWIDLAACFEAVQLAGATFAEMEALRNDIEALKPTGLPAIAVRNYSVRMSLAEQARILAATTFVSRQDIDAVFDQISASFDRAELLAADNQDNVAYLALVRIHAALSNDLATRSRPLARMVTYSFNTRLPSLTLSQRLYQEGGRNDELIDENKPVHPLFMPGTGRALSA